MCMLSDHRGQKGPKSPSPSYGWLQATMWVLGTEAWPSESIADACNYLNHLCSPSLEFLKCNIIGGSACHSIHVEVRRQLFRSQFSLYNVGFRDRKWVVRSVWRMLLSAEPSQQPSFQFFKHFCITVVYVGGWTDTWRSEVNFKALNLLPCWVSLPLCHAT